MQKKLDIFWNGGENMSPCSQLLLFLHVKFSRLLDPKLKLRNFFAWLQH
jgi:hypothetical protein